MGRKGLFITFEGPEGSGKSTHSRLMCDFLRRKGYKVLHTREPGGVVISEKIRKILLDPKNKDMDVVCEMLLYMAARAQIVKEKILPALRQGKTVVCDRFLDATTVYQGYAGGVDVKVIKNLGKLVAGDAMPDMTFLMDIDSKRGLARAGRIRDRMERKSLMFHRAVRKGYLMLAKNEPRRIKVFSGVGDIDETQAKIRKIILRLCHSKR